MTRASTKADCIATFAGYGLWSSSFLDGNERVTFFLSVTGSHPNQY